MHIQKVRGRILVKTETFSSDTGFEADMSTTEGVTRATVVQGCDATDTNGQVCEGDTVWFPVKAAYPLVIDDEPLLSVSALDLLARASQ
jgi:co-chaperonin GroES (HSP10)